MTRRQFLRAIGGVLISGLSSRMLSARSEPLEEPFVGALVSDYLAYQVFAGGVYWHRLHPLQALREHGFSWIMTWLRTHSSSDLRDTALPAWNTLSWKDEYWCALEYSERILREAADFGLRLCLRPFLSHEPALPNHQIIPPEWQSLSLEELSEALEDYCYTVAIYFSNKGLLIERFDIGNEIEAGILCPGPDGACVAKTTDPRTDISYMKRSVWPREAILLNHAISGVKRANPDTKIALHAGEAGLSPGNKLVVQFFQTMIGHGVQFDYASLSYPYQDTASMLPRPLPALRREVGLPPFPKPYFRSSEFRRLISSLSALEKKVILGEYSYPQDSAGFRGSPDPACPYTPKGQANWVREFLSSVLEDEHIAGFQYFYPDYFPEMAGGAEDWIKSSGLFLRDSRPAPAMEKFRRFL